MQNAKFYLETFGCQMNVLDSQLVDGQLRRLGLERVTDCRQADIILFNTCSVRQHAEDKVLSRLGGLQHLKRRRPDVIIGVLGCMAQRQKEDLFSKVPHLDLLCGPSELQDLPALLHEAHQGRRPVAALTGKQSHRHARSRKLSPQPELSPEPALTPQTTESPDPSEPAETPGPAFDDERLEALDLSRTFAPGENVLQSYVRVQRGCDKFCTYCVVPFTRGPERSRPPEHIVDEVRRLADCGCREVTLLGQTVNSYTWRDGHTAVPFARLLEQVQAVPGIDRVRFVTSFPADWDADIFRVMRDYPRVMPYLHIPAQSGSDRILRLMRRGYTVAEYLRLMDAARQYVPHIGLAGDFIVGFCGEAEEDFQASAELVRRVQYQNIFVFKYSPRPGTVADRRRSDDVPTEVKNRRNQELLAIQSEVSLVQKRALIGQTFEVLVEGFSKAAKRLAVAEAPSPSGGAAAVRSAPARIRDASTIDYPQSEQDRGREIARTGSPGWGLPGQSVTRQLVGRTPTDQIVVFEGDPELIGGLVSVRIEAASALTLFGSVQAVVSAARTVAVPHSRPLPLLTD
ncbi:MAG: MiaB/RimO family radical SAM methylthiotransferase [Phycisphaerae bacterium]|nr:MiaB/RimO family radical SAM methylthiotransferase [Phycisphaerae bacterium]